MIRTVIARSIAATLAATAAVVVLAGVADAAPQTAHTAGAAVVGTNSDPWDAVGTDSDPWD
jgi:hypothetical protein